MASFNEPSPVLSTSSSNSVQIRPPGENDVIVGIGCNKHCGNVKFRQFIKAYKRARFRTNPRIETTEAVKEVVVFWRNLSPRGRFLAQSRNSGDGQWHEVEEKQAMRIASFFLLNQNLGGEKKRSKSADAITANRVPSSVCQGQLQGASGSQGQLQGVGQGQLQGMGQGQLQGMGQGQLQGIGQGQLQGTSMGQNQGQGQIQGQFQFQGMGLLQGQVRIQAQSSCNGSQFQGMFQGQTKGQGQFQDDLASLEPVPIGPMSSTSMGWGGAEKPQPEGCVKSFQDVAKPAQAKVDHDFEAFDFNPIPLKFQQDDDFDPLPTNFGFSSSRKGSMGLGSLDVSANKQFGSAPEQLQVSVNMVVNTMPQGYPRENGVNTVTNIQIGTGAVNDDRNKSNDIYSKPYCDSFPGSNFQLTTDASNSFIQISTQSNTQNADDWSANKPGFSNGPSQMNEFQIGFFGNSDDGSACMPGQVGSPGFGGYAGNNGYWNNGNWNNGFSVENDNAGNNTANGNMNNNASGNNGQDNGLRWNKSKVATSVPDAATLVGSVFDDW